MGALKYPQASQLILDELFDLTLYRRLHAAAAGDLRGMLAELIAVEEKHLAFWQDFFDLRTSRLDWGRRAQLWLLSGLCRLLGPQAVHLVLEAIEIHGIRKYLLVWERYKDDPLGRAVQGILRDEFEHEDVIVSRLKGRKIDPEKVRHIFLGLNDGLVEILGALSGFFAAFQRPEVALVAGAGVAVAGSISMAAGVYVAASSEHEMEKIERGRAEFLGRRRAGDAVPGSPLRAGAVVGVSYFLGAAIPILPMALGARAVAAPLATAGLLILLVSLALAFLSGMNIKRRILLNAVIMAGSVGITYLIGHAARTVWGINF